MLARNNERLRVDSIENSIWNACYDLLAARRICEIRTSEIIAKAAVSRSTFYRKFPDKYDVVNYGFRLTYDQCFTFCSAPRAFSKPQIQCLLNELGERRAVVLNAFDSDSPNCLRTFTICYWEKIIMNDLRRFGARKDELARYEPVLKVYLGGIVDYVIDWVYFPSSSASSAAAAMVSLIPVGEFSPLPFQSSRPETAALDLHV